MAGDAKAWLAEHAAEVVGLPADLASAVVADAGLRSRTVRPETIVTLEHRPDRVNLRLDDAGTVVTGASAG